MSEKKELPPWFRRRRPSAISCAHIGDVFTDAQGREWQLRSVRPPSGVCEMTFARAPDAPGAEVIVAPATAATFDGWTPREDRRTEWDEWIELNEDGREELLERQRQRFLSFFAIRRAIGLQKHPDKMSDEFRSLVRLAKEEWRAFYGR